MKNYMYAILILSFLCVSCKKETKRDVAQRLIKDKIVRENIAGYELIQFGALDSAFTSVKETRDYQISLMYYAFYMNQRNQYHGTDDMKSKLYSDSAATQKVYSDSLELAFVPQWIGWRMGHIYKSNNYNKGIVVNNDDYYFDADVSQIVNKKMVYKDLLLKTFEQDKELYGFD